MDLKQKIIDYIASHGNTVTMTKIARRFRSIDREDRITILREMKDDGLLVIWKEGKFSRGRPSFWMRLTKQGREMASISETSTRSLDYLLD